MRREIPVWPLVAATLADYAAQIPYFVHNDYTPAHPLPPLRAVVLLGLTLAWFLLGLRGVRLRRRWGRPVLLSYLLVEALFYAKTFLTGAVSYQMANHSDLVRGVFVTGYLSGLVAAIYLVLLTGGSNARLSPRHESGGEPPADDDRLTRAVGHSRVPRASTTP